MIRMFYHFLLCAILFVVCRCIHWDGMSEGWGSGEQSTGVHLLSFMCPYTTIYMSSYTTDHMVWLSLPLCVCVCVCVFVYFPPWEWKRNNNNTGGWHIYSFFFLEGVIPDKPRGTIFLVCYESRKWQVNIRLIHESQCRCDKRLKSKSQGSTRLVYT
jgi:hypothetical protein